MKLLRKVMTDFNITSFVGRFHPAIVHLPIGILLIAFLFKLLSLSGRYKKLRSAVRPALFYGVLSAIVSVITGYILSLEGGYDERLLVQHKWMGFVTAGLSILVYVFSFNFLPFTKGDRRKVVLILFFPLVVLVLLTGHWGGSLTRGEDYLFESAVSSSNSAEISIKKIPVTNLEEAEVFKDIIKPLLEEKCYRCHSSKKQKGQLRLDAINLIQKGGKNGKILMAGDPDESELFKRVTLSVEEKEHMPPRRESQLTSSEIELMRWWILEGATFEKKVNELNQSAAVSDYLKSLAPKPTAEIEIPKKEVVAADIDVLNELRSSGVAVAQVETSSNYLSVSFAGKKKVDQIDLELLKMLDRQVIELNLARTSVSDEQLSSISGLKELRRLHLEYTQVSDIGIAQLMSCKNLSYLNLVATKISNEALKSLVEIKSLRELYLFNTTITKEGLAILSPQIKIDTGNYQLPFLATDTVLHRKK